MCCDIAQFFNFETKWKIGIPKTVLQFKRIFMYEQLGRMVNIR